MCEEQSRAVLRRLFYHCCSTKPSGGWRINRQRAPFEKPHDFSFSFYLNHDFLETTLNWIRDGKMENKLGN
jgi:hypothetical protein